MVIFGIVWFILGHVWIFHKTDGSNQTHHCKTNVAQFAIAILILDYVFGIWYLTLRLWNSPSVLQWMQRIIQNRLGKCDLSCFLSSSLEHLSQIFPSGMEIRTLRQPSFFLRSASDKGNAFTNQSCSSSSFTGEHACRQSLSELSVHNAYHGKF